MVFILQTGSVKRSGLFAGCPLPSDASGSGGVSGKLSSAGGGGLGWAGVVWGDNTSFEKGMIGLVGV